MKTTLKTFGTALLLAGCASSQPSYTTRDDAVLQRLAQDVTDELTVGRQMAAKLLGHFGAYEADGKAEEYVALVGANLARKVGRPELRFHFGVLKSKEVNAFATPGGYVFVTSGLLGAVKDESELAGVLAHEIAHVNERHMFDLLVPKRDADAGTVMVSLLSRGRSTLGVSLGSVVNRGMELLLDKGLGQPQEIEADAAAVAYTAAAGYNPTALMKFLERAGPTAAKLNRPSPERMSRIRSRVAAEGVANRSVGDETVMQTRFGAALARLSKP